MKRRTLAATVLAHEARLLRRDLGAWLALAVMLVASLYALVSTRALLAERERIVAAARADEAQRLATLQQQLERHARGELAAPTEAWRDPRNPLSVGRGAGAHVVALPPAPLALLAVGLSDLHPPALRVNAGSRDRFLFVDEIANPMHLAAGQFDLAFVIVVVLPLVLLALAHDIVSREREQGTLALLLASGAPLARVLALRLLLRCAPAVLVPILLLAGTAPGALLADPVAFAVVVLAALLYAAVWVALAAWVNSLGRSTAHNAMTLVSAWVLMVWVLPAAINACVQVLHPAPARAEMVQAVREAAVQGEAEQQRFAQQHAAAPRPPRALAQLLEADRRADDVLARQEAMVQRQRALAERLSLLAPPLLAAELLAEAAGSGSTRWQAHAAAINGFHERWQGFFVTKAQAGELLSANDIGRFPRFDAQPPPALSASRVVAVATSLLLLAAVVLGLAILAARQLARAALG